MLRRMYVVCLFLFITSLVYGQVFVKSPFNSTRTYKLYKPLSDEVVLHYDGDNVNGIGLNGGGTFEYGVRFTKDEIGDFAGITVKKVLFFINQEATSVILKFYYGTSGLSTDTCFFEQEIGDFNVGDWTEYILPENIALDNSKEFWVTITVSHTSGKYPAGIDGGTTVVDKGDLINLGDSWLNINQYGIDGNWNIRVYAEVQGAEHDVKLLEISNCSGQLDPQQSIEPIAKVKNIGQNAEVCNVFMRFTDTEGNIVYSDTVKEISLDTNEVKDITFTAFTAEANTFYYAECGVLLDSDLNVNNNNLSSFFNTYNIVKDYVLLEIFTGTWCPYCPGAAMGADDLVEKGHNVAVVEYHGGDSYENDYGKGRSSFYDPSGYPTAIFDGVMTIVGGNNTNSLYDNYKVVVDSANNIKTCMNLALHGESTGDNKYSITLTINNNGKLPSQNIRAFVVLTESDIKENWQGQTKLDFVERVMLGNGAEGNEFDLSSEKEKVDLTFDLTLDASWVKENCELVAFVQNLETKEVYASTKKELNKLLPVGVKENRGMLKETNLIGNYPNPFNPSTKIKFYLSENTDVKLEIYNIVGQKIRTLVDEKANAGLYTVEWNGKDNKGNKVPSGVYLYRLVTPNKIMTKKLLLMK